MLLFKALAIWFLLAVLAILNGTIRTFLIPPFLGEQAAHTAGTLGLLLIQFTVIYFFIKKNSLTDKKELIIIF